MCRNVGRVCKINISLEPLINFRKLKAVVTAVMLMEQYQLRRLGEAVLKRIKHVRGSIFAKDE